MTKMLTRDDFQVPDAVAYFNTAYMGITPRPVTEALEIASHFKARPWERTVSDFFTQADAFRHAAAALIGASARDIAIKGSVSSALSEAASWFSLQEGDEILVCEGQFPSNVYPWRSLAARTGATVKAATRRWNESWTEALLAAITPRTRIAALPHVHWIDGAIIDLARIRAALAEGGILALDLTQSAGALPFDIACCDPDIVVAATYKWLLGPYSLAFAFIAPRWHAALPAESGWINRVGSEDFTNLTDYRDGLREDASRFDMGERSNFHLLPAATLALEILRSSLEEGLHDELTAIHAPIAHAIRRCGVGVEEATIRSGHYLSVELPAHAPDDLPARLAGEHIFVSQRGRRLRLTGHVHIREHDTERLLSALARHLA